MKKNAKKFFSMLLALAMLLSMVPMTAFATETEDQAEAVVDAAVDTAEEVTATAEEAEEEEISFNFASVAPALLNADETEVDEDDPAIIAFEAELKEIKVLMADGSVGNLTDEQVQTILGMYQQYLDHWEENANILGVQTPFFLQYNDNEDGLGILGEMLILGGNTVDQIRNGELSYDDITGMITTFLFADTFGVQLYGDAVKSARDEILDLVEASGAQTDVQKYMVINNWLAQNVEFDMEYIMNTDKDTNGDGVIDDQDDNEDSMVAENPQEHEYYDVVYDAIYDEYEPQIEQMFYDQIYAAIEADLRQTFYEEVIRQMVYDGYLDGARASDDVVNGAKQMYYADQYEAALAEEEQRVYDEAYAAYATHEHDLEATFTWNADLTAATATATCKNGLESYEAVNAEVTSSTTATCTEAGKITYTATATFTDDAGATVGTATDTKEADDAALGHNYEDGVCTRCKAVSEDHEHSYAVTSTDAPTCTEEGTEYLTCACGDSKTSAIAATGHNITSAVTKEATCTEEGITTFTCQNDGCDYSYSEPIEMVAHQVVDNKCTVCGAEFSTGTEEGGEEEVGGEVTEDPEAPVNAEGDVDPDADNYAKKVVEEKQEEIKAAADEKANAAVEAATDETLSPYIEAIVVGDEETTTDVEAAAADYADKFMEDNKADIEATEENPDAARDFLVNFLTEQTGSADAAAQYMVDIDAQCDAFIEDAETNGVEVQPGYKMTIAQLTEQQLASEDPAVDLDEDGTPDVTFAQAIQIYTDAAAAQLTEAVLNYWQGSHFGALGRGSAVCLGYTKAFAYLVQCLHADIYTGGASIDTASNWKNAEDLYYTNGELDISKNYAVDCVRISFDAEVTMYGETQENFNSDHFWNAVKVDGQWYYVDPCYVDVYTEVMIRDRVETDGSLNYLYFMFSHGTAADLYDGYYSEIKTLYADAATYTDYEDSWISRVKSTIYPEDGYFYYVYDSTDMVTLMEEYENSTDASDIDINDSEIKLVRHKLSNKDAGTDGDTNYDTLIEFNYAEDEDSDETVARVLSSDGTMVENEMLTTLFAQHQDDREIYPSLAITCALSGSKIYFNLSNCLLSYDLSTCEVTLVKEYNTVYGVRDDTVAFGGMAFSTTSSASGADFTVEDHPIAGITLKDDGNLYVSIATNFAFISGKDPHNSADQGSYGYEFEETNYNAEYNSYTNDQYDDSMYEQMGYEKETNDNDEFMWSANFVETLSMSHLTGSSHNYESVSVEASCRHNAYTENRCSTCGAIEADSRVEEADTAHEHHFLRFEETYYTKNDNGNWNSGFCYVCTECLFAIEEPTEPDPDEDYESYGTTYEEQMAIYEEEKAIYDYAVETAGHDYVAVDATWNEDYSTATFTEVICGANCPDAKLDVLVDDTNISKTFSNPATISGSDIIGYTGDCTTGAYCHYQIVGETNGITVTATTAVQREPGEHPYTAEFTWTQVTDENGNVVYMDNGYAQYTASAVLTCEICGDSHTDESADVTVEVINPTVEEQGKVLYTAKAIATNDSGTQIGSATGVKEITLVASPEVTINNVADSGKPRLQWAAVDGAVRYNIYASTDGGATYTKTGSVTGTKVTHGKAVTGETYHYYVTAVSDDDMESDAKENVVSTICKIARTTVTLSNIAKTGKIKVSWEAVDGAAKYEVYLSDNGGESYTKVSTTIKTSINHNSAVAGVQYRYKVKVVPENPEATSAFSSAKYRTCDLPRTNVTLSNIESTGKIKITWEAVEGAVKYDVYRSDDGGENYEKVTTTTKTSINHGSAKAGQVYYYKVVAVAENTSANSAASTAKYRTCDLARPDVSVSRNSKGKPVLTWDKISGAQKYEVRISTDGGETFEKTTTTTGTSISHGSAKAGKTYTYQVRAIAENSAANSAYSVADSIKAK